MLPRVTRNLIVANVGIYFIQMILGEEVIAQFALWPLNVAQAEHGEGSFAFWQLVTYAFLHGSLLHLAFNMLALYMFGAQLEDLLGARRFLSLYFISILSAALMQLLVLYFTNVQAYPTVGASGGIFGVLLAFAYYFPNRRVMLLFPPIPLPARVFVLIYGALELVLGVTGAQEGVAHFAHLGGMLGAGMLLWRWRRVPA